ncbi:MAG: hypothetical protein MK202_01910 [Tenacibaculum sp.]|nr:hypothetical protein [Tenacibaculum sp.]
MIKRLISFLLIIFVLIHCKNKNEKPVISAEVDSTEETVKKPVNSFTNIEFENTSKTIHIIVALCDNKYQGIIPVPEKIGNGQDPKNNLYWGTAYGIKSYFRRSPNWTLKHSKQVDSIILERIVFKHKTKNYTIVADAYDGKYIKNATETFLRSSAGIEKDIININKDTIGIKGNSNLVAYIGHDGLMDFQLNEKFINTDQKKRDVIILACYSKNYFQPHLRQANINPLVWTTGLMAPEAYTIHDAIEGYMNKESNEAISLRAAKAYHKYQKCGLKGAQRLLVTN